MLMEKRTNTLLEMAGCLARNTGISPTLWTTPLMLAVMMQMPVVTMSFAEQM
jgi:hypothetical protein